MFRDALVLWCCVFFLLASLRVVHADEFNIAQLPAPGNIVYESPAFIPLLLKGLIVNPRKPLELQFVVDTGMGGQDAGHIRNEVQKAVKYFLAGLTIPEGDLWVNLSPYEKSRILTPALGRTDLGRDLLAQDYILKQRTASLIYPESRLGREFWSRIYTQVKKEYGTNNLPINTFNKVWIMPAEAQVYERDAAVYVTKSTMRIMLDEDYMALHGLPGRHNRTDPMVAQIVRQIILPEIQREVNTGTNFAPLRQIYNAMILAKWYKETIANGILDTLYINKRRTAGLGLDDPAIKERIYERYLQAYKKGVFSYIQDEAMPDGKYIPRKYFSGGFTAMGMQLHRDGAMSSVKGDGAMVILTVKLVLAAGLSKVGLVNAKEYVKKKNSDDLLRILRYWRGDMKIIAAEELARRKDSRVVDPLIDLMADKRFQDIASAAKIFVALGADKAVDPLFQAANKNIGSGYLFIVLLKALGELGANKESIIDLAKNALVQAEKRGEHIGYNRLSNYLFDLGVPEGSWVYSQSGEILNPGARHWESTSYFNGSISQMGDGGEWISDEIRAWIKVERNPDAAQKSSDLGGIDLNTILIHRSGRVIQMHFDHSQLEGLTQVGFEGFVPSIIDVKYIPNQF